MHADARNLPDGSEVAGDVCIIGAGAAGLSIASELAGTSHEVVLLESGGFEREPSVQSLYKGKNTGLPYYALDGSRLRYFGGTTNHWTGFCSPFDPIDFQERDWIPHSGWPIDRSDLDPYYRRAHSICDLGPYRYDTEYWTNQYNEYDAFPFDRSRVWTKMFQLSEPTRFGDKYRSEIVDADNITLWTHATVTNIKTIGDDDSVTELEIQCLNGQEHQASAQCYILACGALENPRLLLNSNDNNPAGLGNEHDIVGRYFMETPRVPAATLRLTWDSSVDSLDLYDWTDTTHKGFGLLSLGPAEQEKKQVANYNAVVVRRYQTGTLKQTVKNALYEVGILQPPRDCLIRARPEQTPNPRSRVTLSAEKDALGQPRIALHWDLTEREKRTIRAANEAIAQEVGRLGIGRLRVLDWTTEQNDSWPNRLTAANHHIGTTRMSERPSEGIVDANCKVHGVDNLYIAGSSVFPTSGAANPTFTIVALALRLSEHIESRLQ